MILLSQNCNIIFTHRATQEITKFIKKTRLVDVGAHEHQKVIGILIDKLKA